MKTFSDYLILGDMFMVDGGTLNGHCVWEVLYFDKNSARADGFKVQGEFNKSFAGRNSCYVYDPSFPESTFIESRLRMVKVE